jgi:hypothetical protein
VSRKLHLGPGVLTQVLAYLFVAVGQTLLKKSHRAPSQRPSHGLSIFSVINRSAVDNRSNGQGNSGRTAGRARGTRWSESESEPPPLSLQSELNRKTGDLHRPLLWHRRGPGLVPGNLIFNHLNHGTCIYFRQSPILTKARIYNIIRGKFVGNNNCTTYEYASIVSIIVALLVWLLAFCNLRYASHRFQCKIHDTRFLLRTRRRKKQKYFRLLAQYQLRKSRFILRIVFGFIYLLVFNVRADLPKANRESLISYSWVGTRIRWRKSSRRLPNVLRHLCRILDDAMAEFKKIRTICSDILVEEFCKAQPFYWRLKHWIIHALLFSSLSRLINDLDAIIIAAILTLVWILLVCFVSQTSDILWKPFLKILTMTYLIILWGIVDVLGHIRDEYSDIILAATLFKAIVCTTMRILIYTLFSSTTLLLDVITLLTLQFLLALCGDVHPNPGPCKSKKSKTNIKKTNAENSPISTNGESAKMFGTSINLLNWNARGLGRVKEQKVQDLLGLMNENDVQIAIVSETRESAGSQNQTQTQANGYTIYKNAYREISHTSQYLSPEKMVWGVCLIVKNGLAFSISKIHDLTSACPWYTYHTNKRACPTDESGHSWCLRSSNERFCSELTLLGGSIKICR